jgi:hypothetical protein
VYNITLDIKSTDGKPVRVILGRVDGKTITLLGDCQIDKWGSLKLKTYWWIKYLIRKTIGINLGEKGPSWI